MFLRWYQGVPERLLIQVNPVIINLAEPIEFQEHILEWPCVLGFTGCYNKIPHTGWLKQLTLISHYSRSWKVQDRGASRFDI